MSDTEPNLATSAAKSENPHAKTVLRLADAIVKVALWPSIGVAIIAVAVATVWIGLPGLYGSLVGVALAFGSSLGTLLLMRKTAHLDPMAVMLVAMGGYVFKIVLLLVVKLALGGHAIFHPKSLALSFLAVVVVWAVADGLGFHRAKLPTIIPNNN